MGFESSLLKRRLKLLMILFVLTGSIAVGQDFFAKDRDIVGDNMSKMTTTGAEEGVFLPIIMYHSVVENGTLGDYVVSSEMLEQDLIWLRDKGYETVVVEDLIEYVKGEGQLPPKPVMITFDDGMKNNVSVAFEVMKKYNAKGVYSVVGSFCDKGYPYMDWEELEVFSKEYLVEIQHHSYDFHDLNVRKGSMRMQGEGFCEYITEFSSDTSEMQRLLAEKTGIKATCYTYPFGLISPETYPVLESMGFEASMSCIEKGNFILKGDGSSLYLLKRYNRASDESTDDFMKRVTRK